MKSKIIDYFHYIYFYLIYKLAKYQTIVNSAQLPNICLASQSIVIKPIPKIIWIYWHDEKTPELITYCIQKIRKLHKQYDVHILNKSNINKFIDIEVEVLLHKMPIANLSDFIRLKLLHKYGGIWLDASIIINKPLDQFMYVEQNIYDVIGYYNAEQTQQARLPVIDSWLIAAPLHSEFIKTWLSYFEPIAQLGAHEFHQKMTLDKDYKSLSAGLADPKYLLVYIAAKQAYRDVCNYKNLLFYPSDQSAFFIQTLSKWRTRRCTKNFYLANGDIDSPLFKLTRGDRKYYSFLKNHHLINSKSIIGKLMMELKHD